MGTAKIFIVFTLFSAIGIYWLTSPVPDGYSFQSSLQLRKMNALMKVFGLTARLGGFERIVNVSRSVKIDSASSAEDNHGVMIESAVFNNIPVHIYRSSNEQNLQPGFVYYHGGGWVLSSVAEYESLMVLLCQKTKAVFVSVDYRLAPEYVYPTAFEDSLAATEYFLRHAEKYNVDPRRIAIGGDSAGGNLAAAVALKLRDVKFEPKVKMQVLIYPVLQSIDYQLPSMIKNSDGPILSQRTMAWFASLYLTGSDNQQDSFVADTHVPSAVKQQLASTHLNVNNLPKKYLIGYARQNVQIAKENVWESIKDKMFNPYFSPLLASDVGRLPMAYVFTCEHDVLRDEGLLYAYRLKEAGNAVTHVHSDIGFHGIMSIGMKWPEGEAVINAMTKHIVDNL